MLFAIDIDQTIAGGENTFRLYVKHHIQDLGLAIPSSVIEALPDYRGFLHLPEVIAYRQTNEARFQESRASCRISPKVVLALKEIPGAVAGLQYLSTFGTVRYYTIRSPQVLEITKEWLASKMFPHPDDVICCTDTLDKLIQLSQQTAPDETIILIDDRKDEMLRAFEKLLKIQQPIAQHLESRLILVAFGNKEPIPLGNLHPIKVTSLPSWQSITEIAASFHLSSNRR